MAKTAVLAQHHSWLRLLILVWSSRATVVTNTNDGPPAWIGLQRPNQPHLNQHYHHHHPHCHSKSTFTAPQRRCSVLKRGLVGPEWLASPSIRKYEYTYAACIKSDSMCLAGLELLAHGLVLQAFDDVGSGASPTCGILSFPNFQHDLRRR